MTNKFYAHYCKWGCNAVHANDTSRYWGEYYAFPTKRARDKWVEDHYLNNSNVVSREATRKEVVSQLGKDFTISESEFDMFDGGMLCERNTTTY